MGGEILEPSADGVVRMADVVRDVSGRGTLVGLRLQSLDDLASQ
jgi:hypothetical protein